MHENSHNGLPVRVFVSYAQENPEHKRNVLRLCRLLAAVRVEVRVDQWAPEGRRDWQLWATAHILGSDYILVVASETCRLVGDGRNTPGTNLGLQSEMRLLRELYHHEPEVWIARMLPVLLPGSRVDHIPLFLQPSTADHFRVTSYTPEGAADLIKLLRGGSPSDGLLVRPERTDR